jgi:hypothetical protein
MADRNVPKDIFRVVPLATSQVLQVLVARDHVLEGAERGKGEN